MKEWKNWVLPLHCPFIFAHNLFCPLSFLCHKTHTHPVPLIYVPTPTWALPRKPEFPEHVWVPILSFITILRYPLCCCFSCHFTFCIFLQTVTSLEEGTTSNIFIFSPSQHPASVLLKRNVDWRLKPHPHSRFPTPLHVWLPSQWWVRTRTFYYYGLVGIKIWRSTGNFPSGRAVLAVPPSLLDPAPGQESVGFLNLEDFHCYWPKSYSSPRCPPASCAELTLTNENT